jgi:hypothetical protein
MSRKNKIPITIKFEEPQGVSGNDESLMENYELIKIS